MEPKRIIRYRDERNDEFSTAVITPRRIDQDYVYLHTSVWKRVTHFFWYRIVATPIAFLYVKLVHGQRTVNRAALAQWRRKGYFLYGNHTQDIGDAFLPHLLNFPKSNYTVVHPNNVSMPLLGRITPSLGALPLPDDLAATRNFSRAIATRIREGHTVVIYPEAHIWPYYTGIRPFSAESFYYPVRENVPVFCFTNTYQPHRGRKKPRIVTYIDGPFFPDPHLPARERAAALCSLVREQMLERAKNSTVEWIRYEKEEDPTDD